MYQVILDKLRERNAPIHVAVVGCGWLGSRIVRELYRIGGLDPKVIIDRDVRKGVTAYLAEGIAKEDIVVARTAEELCSVQHTGKYLVCSRISLIEQLDIVDVVFEATGEVNAGASAATAAFANAIHFVTMSSEMDATVGYRLARIAQERGLVYSVSDGDQPGCLARMLNEIEFQGFTPKLVGNGKQFFDPYQTPERILPFVPEGHDPYKICSFTDGTKQSSELACIANGFGLYPLRRAMHGPTTSKQDLIENFDRIVKLDSLEHPCIEYSMGTTKPDEGGPVFVIACRRDPRARADLEYLKKGPGPYYLFFRDHHLCHFEAASSVALAVLFHSVTLAPKGWFVDVISIAKRDLERGRRLDGIGGFDCYGVVDRADVSIPNRLLPIGLAAYATLKTDVEINEPITYDMVELEDNVAVRLRAEQDLMWAAEAPEHDTAPGIETYLEQTSTPSPS